MHDLATNLKKIRLTKKMSQRDISNKVSISNDYISKIESGKIKNVGIKTLEKIAEALDINLDSLICIRNRSNTNEQINNPLKWIFLDEKIKSIIMKLIQSDIDQITYDFVDSFLSLTNTQRKLLVDIINIEGLKNQNT